MGMKTDELCITSIEIKPAENTNKNLMAYVSLILSGGFLVKDIKVINGPKGLFVAMPARKGKDGKFHDIFHPINQETRSYVENAIIEKYNQVTNNPQ